MMFEDFENAFPRDLKKYVGDIAEGIIPNVIGLPELLKLMGGASFSGGLYRIICHADLELWKSRVTLAFPQFKNRILCFGYDWLGSVFAIDFERFEGTQPGVVMFEPGTGKVLEIPFNILTFHNSGLKEFGEAILAISFFQEWLGGGGERPLLTQCVGYKRPLFFGGKDDIENLELSDIDVYWHIVAQLICKARELPVGVPISVRKG